MRMPKKPKKVTAMENQSTNTNNKSKYSTTLPSQLLEMSIFPNIDKNFEFLNSLIGKDIGLIEGKYAVLNGKVQIGVVYIASITDNQLVSRQVIEPLLRGEFGLNTDFDDILTQIQSKFIYTSDIERTTEMKQIVDNLFIGSTVLFVDGIATAFIIGSRKIEQRPIEKPDNEVVVFGAKESFIEDLQTNISMVIKRLPTPDLCFESFTIGTLSRTEVKLLWMKDIANTTIVEEARQRLKSIEIDMINDLGALAELIEDKPLSIFPKWRQTQRPDMVAKSLSDGYFAILCNNTPFVLIGPGLFWDNFKTMDDYTEGSIVSSYLRSTRYIAFLLSIIVSPLYLSFVAYNHAIVPPPLAINIAAGREGVPLPSVVELLILSFAITVIREASIRMSGAVGFFIGVLAALVIGDAAVTAGYVSSSVIIVVAISAISAYAIATTVMVIPSRLINLFLILLAGLFGMFGLISGIAIILWHAVSLESFGVPYLYPLVPFDLEGMKDTFIRAPIRVLKKRLNMLAPYNPTRINNKKHEGE
ncbi:spore germination protein KA [Clostridium aceticum]|uniref:Spore germination protein KA n=1 Tax=Clostridium aceticum TaxID=84022 RepID=A0A0G3W9Y8_9CLOT|nr:spore germination protein [Clostridium aceticum]AKL94685.1 spore germination protein KA [Clostridium aceticum]